MSPSRLEVALLSFDLVSNLSFVSGGRALTDPGGSEVKFDAQGDGLARYTIMNYRRLATGGYDYKVGVFGC